MLSNIHYVTRNVTITCAQSLIVNVRYNLTANAVIHQPVTIKHSKTLTRLSHGYSRIWQACLETAYAIDSLSQNRIPA